MRLYMARFLSLFILVSSLLIAKNNNVDADNIMKIVQELKVTFGDHLKDMRIIEIGATNEDLKEKIAETVGYASYIVIRDSELLNVDVSFDLFLCCNAIPHNIEKSQLEALMASIPYGFMDIPSINVVEDLTQLLNNSRKGNLVYNTFQGKQARLKLYWKPISDISTTALKSKVIYKNDKKAKQQQNAVTYSFSGGRFGDNLMAYFHAKWIARTYGFAFLYKSFPGAEWLALSQMDTPFSQASYKKKVKVRNIRQMTAPHSTLFVVPYFSDSKFEYDMLNHEKEGMPYFVVDWEDPEFKKEIQESLKPLIPVEYLPLPQDCLTVAMHVRRGGNYEQYEQAAKGYPLKFAPDEFYIKELKRIAAIFPEQLIYAHIFTDDLNPEQMANRFSDLIQNPRITISWNKQKFSLQGSDRMLNDFYSIGKFDCLICGQSNFSILAALLGQYALMITPTHAHFEKEKIVIDQTRIQFKSKK